MFDIICIGSATIDVFVDTENKLFHGKKDKVLVPFGSKILIEDMRVSTGGGGSNTASAFSRFGFRTGYIGNLGDDEHTLTLLDSMKKDKVNTSLAVKRGRSGYSVILDAKGHDRTILAFKGSNNDLRSSDIKFSRLKTKLFYFGTMLDQAYKTQYVIAKHAKQKKIPVAMNMSLYLAKKGKKFLAPMLKCADIIIMNKEEAKALTKKSKVPEQIKELHKFGPGTVVVTDSKNGAYASNGKERLHVYARKLKIIEATGAGDAFASGFVAGIIRHKDLRYALQMGQAEAESVLTHYGAKEKLLTLAEIKNIIKKKPAKITRF
ncbi:carbohydrate kinase family protein [Candidatus Woesearchaeota archaeon]|nr:carbohydrate kinase family protein [Candidatus Woesearchaeota archaeon]